MVAETAVMCMKAGIEANPIYTPEVMDDEVRRLFRFREAILNREGKFKIICYPEQMAFLQAYFGELAERFLCEDR